MNVVSCRQLQPNDHCHSPQCLAQCRSHPCGTFRNCQGPWKVGHGWLQINLENITSIAVKLCRAKSQLAPHGNTLLATLAIPASSRRLTKQAPATSCTWEPTKCPKSVHQTWCCHWHWHLPNINPNYVPNHLAFFKIARLHVKCRVVWKHILGHFNLALPAAILRSALSSSLPKAATLPEQ